MALFPFIVEDEIIHIIELTSDFLGELRPCLVKSDKPRCKNINVNKQQMQQNIYQGAIH